MSHQSTLVACTSHPALVITNVFFSKQVYGHIKGGALDGVPVAACLGDQQSALVGHAALSPGQGKVTYGTGAFMLLNTGTDPVQSQNGLLTTVAYQLGPKSPVTYALEGSVAVAGVGVSWLVDNMQLLQNPTESEAVARSCAPPLHHSVTHFISHHFHMSMQALSPRCGLAFRF